MYIGDSDMVLVLLSMYLALYVGSSMVMMYGERDMVCTICTQKHIHDIVMSVHVSKSCVHKFIV